MTDNGPGEHPAVPEDFDQRELPRKDFAHSLWRIYRNQYDNPLFFRTEPRYRFDAPQGNYGVCYCGCDEYVSFVETLGHSPTCNLVTLPALSLRSLIQISVDTPLEIVDLTGEGLRIIGADSRLITGDDYDLSRRWSQAIHEHPDEVDGILYRSRNDPSRQSVAVFERASDRLEVDGEWRLDTDKGFERILPIIDHYEFGIG